MTDLLSTGSDTSVREAHERLVAALRASKSGTWRWDIPSDTVKWDEALSHVYGIDHANAPKTSSEFLGLIHPDDREYALGVLRGCLESGSEVNYEFRAAVNGKIIWIYDRSMLVRDAEGRPHYMTGACIDITDRKKIEEERNLALQRQKLLLVELNHRVKNHLQMVSSILQLQARRQENGSARSAFENAIQRIGTIGDLHARLYRDEAVERVDVSEYLSGLCDKLGQSLVGDTSVALRHEFDPIYLTVDEAVPLGLIVNEIITNAVKHAFPNGNGTINVRLRKRAARIHLAVWDDGQGIRKDNSRKSGIGMRIVSDLVKQLRGELRKRTGERGTAFHLLFRSTLDSEVRK